MDYLIDYDKLSDSAVVEMYNAANTIVRHYYSFCDGVGVDIDKQKQKPIEFSVPLEILRKSWRVIVLRELPVKALIVKTTTK